MDFLELGEVTDSCVEFRRRDNKKSKADRKSKDLSVYLEAAGSDAKSKSPKLSTMDRTSSKILKLMKRSMENLSSPKVSRTSEFYANHVGTLLEICGTKERAECKMVLDHEALRWEGERRRDSLFIQTIRSVTASNSGEAHWPASFELACINNEIKVFAAKTNAERAEWMQKIIQIIAPSVFTDSITSNFTRAGIVTIKDATSVGPGWMILNEKELYYWLQNSSGMLSVDLRLARKVDTMRCEGDELCVHLELPDKWVQVVASSERETSRWWMCLRDAPRHNGTRLEYLQFEQNQVPVVVDICTDYVTTYGVDIPGLYEDAEVNPVNVARLYAHYKMNKNAREIQLDNFSAYDVAAALKRFFSELQTPLFSDKLVEMLLGIRSFNEEMKVPSLKGALAMELEGIYLMTARKLFGHLYYLHTNSDLADVAQFAKSWTPALVSINFHGNSEISGIIQEIIMLYPEVFDVEYEELLKETELFKAVKLYRTSMKGTIRANTNINLWISIGDFLSHDVMQVTVDPDTTVADVYDMLGKKEDMILQEFVLGGVLFRPLHPSEKVRQVILAWSTWEEQDRRDNQLVLSPCLLYQEFRAQGKARCLTKGELRFADSGSRYSVSCEVELDQVAIHCYRDKRYSLKLGQWNVRDLIWYVGNDPRRDSFSRWAITFFSKNETPRSRDYFGNMLGGSSKKELLYWGSGLLLSRFPGYL